MRSSLLRGCRRLGAATTLAGGCALSHNLHTQNTVHLHSAPPPVASEEGAPRKSSQWLWTVDGIDVLRDETSGETRFVDSATGQVLPSRPAAVPAEAYANRLRWPPHPAWDESSEVGVIGERPPRSTRGGVRHLLLVRHSQYATEAREDAQRVITDLGREQARRLGARLAAIHAASDGYYKHYSLSVLQSSELTRAVQTADELSVLLPLALRSRDATLNEGRPCLPEPAPRHAQSYTNRDAERMERSYRKLVRKPSATDSSRSDTYEVVVCHANLIRYVVCRALQLPPEAWLRMSLPNASLTHLVVRPNGDVTLRMLGDAGHLPPEMVSY
jgi:broad specificity phosphatase PhoE